MNARQANAATSLVWAGVIAAGALAAGLRADASEPVRVPSGQEVRFLEVIRDARGAAGLTYRFRFVAPGIARAGGTVDFQTAMGDMEALCRTFALPRVSDLGPRPAQIVISLSSDETEFGAAAPEVTSFFEAYRIEGSTCIWEGF